MTIGFGEMFFQFIVMESLSLFASEYDDKNKDYTYAAIEARITWCATAAETAAAAVAAIAATTTSLITKRRETFVDN